MKGIGIRFKKIRELLGLSQAKFAEVLGLKQGFISNIETEYRVPDEQTIRLLEREYGISKQWLTTGEGVIFNDSDKALQVLKQVKVFGVEEVYYVLSKIQDIYSKFSDYSVNDEIILRVSRIISENLQGVQLKENISDLFSILTKHILDNSKISDKFKNDLTNFINDIGIYIFTAAVLYEKYDLTPLASKKVDLSALKIKVNENLEKQIRRLIAEKETIKILNYYDNFLVNFEGKGYIELSKEKLFGFASIILNLEKDEGEREILDFKIFWTDIEKVASIKQKDINLSLTTSEFSNLKYCFEKLKENKTIWEWLQFLYIEKYGFV